MASRIMSSNSDLNIPQGGSLLFNEASSEKQDAPQKKANYASVDQASCPPTFFEFNG